MIDRQTWAILGDRLVELRRWREQLADDDETVTLEFDAHDQARVVHP